MVEEVLEVVKQGIGKGSASEIWNNMDDWAVVNGGRRIAPAGSGLIDY
jgi:hypothetical protein